MLPIISKRNFLQGIQYVFTRSKWCIIGVSASFQEKRKHFTIFFLEHVAGFLWIHLQGGGASVSSQKSLMYFIKELHLAKQSKSILKYEFTSRRTNITFWNGLWFYKGVNVQTLLSQSFNFNCARFTSRAFFSTNEENFSESCQLFRRDGV